MIFGMSYNIFIITYLHTWWSSTWHKNFFKFFFRLQNIKNSKNFQKSEIFKIFKKVQNFQNPQILDEEPGTPNCCRKGSPGNTRPPKTPISMCGHQTQGRKSATNSRNLWQIMVKWVFTQQVWYFLGTLKASEQFYFILNAKYGQFLKKWAL